MRAFFGPYQSFDLDEHVKAWTPPQGSVGSIDLRSLPAMSSTPGGNSSGENIGVFIGGDDFSPGSDYSEFPSGHWDADDTKRFRQRFRLQGNLIPSQLMDAVGILLTHKADHTGENGPRPLVPGIRNKRFRLGPLVIGQPAQDLIGDSALIRQLRSVYHEHRKNWLAGDRDEDNRVYLKWLGYQLQKYKLTGNQYRSIQGGNPDEQPLKPETTITESFNTADSTTLGPDLSWTELADDNQFDVFSNNIRAIGSRNANQRVARADTDLSGDDHYSQIEVTAHSGLSSAGQIGPMCRKDGSTTHTYYMSMSDAASIYIFKVVSAGYTLLDSAVQSLSLPDTIKMECDGSALETFFNGSSVLTATDTGITGNLRCGVYGEPWSSTSDVRGDNFEAADLGAAPPGILYTQLESFPRGMWRGMRGTWGGIR